MTENRFPSDPMQDLRDMQRAVGDNTATSRPPLIEASAGWVMRHRSSPPVPPSGDVHIYAQSGRLWCRSTLGDVPLLTQNQAAAVETITTSDAGASYDTTAQFLINKTKATVNDLLDKLRIAGVVSNS